MAPFVFDTLSASKQLREAGMSEGVAEAVVSVFQHAAAMPDISHLATKADLEALGVATKAELEILRAEMATRADLEALCGQMAAKADIADMATGSDIEAVRTEIKMVRLEMQVSSSDIRAEFSDKLRQQGWMILGGVAVLLTISTAMTRVLAG